MNKADLNPEIIETITNVFKRHADITFVVLFGSRAKGTAKYNSDIDLAIFGIQEDLSIEAISMELEELPLPYKFDVKAFDTICNSELREHIKRVGIMIYEK